MENSGSKHKTKNIIAIVVVLLICVVGLVLAINWQNWFGKKLAQVYNVEELESGTYAMNFDGNGVIYNAKYIIDGVELKLSSGEYTSDTDGEVLFLVINGGALTISDAKITKTGSDDYYLSGEDSNLYGSNSVIVVLGDGSQANLTNVEVITDANSADAVAALDGGSVNIAEGKITTGKTNANSLIAGTNSKINVNGCQIKNDSVLASMVYTSGNVTMNNVVANLYASVLATVKGEGKLTINGGGFTLDWPFSYAESSSALYSSVAILANGAPSLTISGAEINQETYAGSSENEEIGDISSAFVVDNANANIKLDNTTIKIADGVAPDDATLVFATNNSKATMDVHSLTSSVNGADADPGSTVIGL